MPILPLPLSHCPLPPCCQICCLSQTITTNVSCTEPARCTHPQQFGDPNGATTRCSRDQLLPCFLRFADYAVPREDSSNMKCKPILRKPLAQAQQDCAGSGPQQLGEQASNIPEKPTDRLTAQWDLDPSYYQYQTCECLLVSRVVGAGLQLAGTVYHSLQTHWSQGTTASVARLTQGLYGIPICTTH